VGNILGPALAEWMLATDHQPHFESFTALQSLYLAVGAVMLAVAFFFGLALCCGGVNGGESKQEESGKEQANVKPNGHVQKVILALMAAFFCLGNGINFGFSGFLTVFAARHPELLLSTSAGARATGIFFTSSAAARALAIPLVTFVPAGALIVSNLMCLIAGCAWLSSGGLAEGEVSFVYGVVLVGVGVSTLFSSGLLWLRNTCAVSARMTSLFLIATSVGAQCFKPLVAYFIEEEPMTLVWVVSVAAFLTCGLFISSFLLHTFNRLSRASKYEANVKLEDVSP